MKCILNGLHLLGARTGFLLGEAVKSSADTAENLALPVEGRQADSQLTGG